MNASPSEQRRRSDNNHASSKKPHIRPRKLRRGFQEVPLFPVGYQDGKKRFPHDRGSKPPKINSWRNNLTAASQRHNLYFVACLDWIYAYKPLYPHQAVPDQPCLKWKLPVSRQGLPGYLPPDSLDEYSAHSVNNLLVADLGSKEVIVCACDDGDVIAYHTETLDNDANNSNEDPADGPDEPMLHRALRSCFHQNVGKSAWGLAVHTEARLIAVSSNSHHVTVFAPALDDDNKSATDGTPDSKSTGEAFPPSDLSMFGSKEQSLLHDREFNRRRVLKRHSTNIPSISFCNTPEDTSGRYLASTDISGVTIIWNVDTGKSVRVLGPLRREPGDDMRYTEDYDTSRDGWGIMFLDPRCFTRTTSIVQAMGTCTRVKHDLNAREPLHSMSMYNISESQGTVRNSAPWNLYKKQPAQDAPSSDAASDATSAPSTPRLTASNSNSRYPDGSDDDGEDSDQSSSALELNIFRTRGRNFTTSQRSTLQKNKLGIIPEEQLGPGISPLDLMGHRWSIFSHYTIQSTTTPTSHIPQSPLLFLNPRKAHLFQSPDLNLRERQSTDPNHPTHYPVIYLEDPLAQQVPANLAVRLQHLDRMNLHTQIPELGIVLVGSPKGRVAVLTLHLLEPRYDPDTAQPETDVEEPMYTMRLDHLLPLREQEERNQRPLQPLVGIAASPVFGIEDRRQRYRIFLTYLNHTVLVYEIGREGSGHGGYGDVFAL